MADVKDSASTISSKKDFDSMKTPVKKNPSKSVKAATPGIRSSNRLKKLKEINLEENSTKMDDELMDDGDLLAKMKNMKLTKTPSKSKKQTDAIENNVQSDFKDIFAIEDEEYESTITQNKEKLSKSPSRTATKSSPSRTPSLSRRAAATKLRENTNIESTKKLNFGDIFFDEMNKENATPSRAIKVTPAPTRTPSSSRRKAAAVLVDEEKQIQDNTNILVESTEKLDLKCGISGKVDKENATPLRTIKATPTRTPSVSRRKAAAAEKNLQDGTPNLVKFREKTSSSTEINKENPSPSPSRPIKETPKYKLANITDGLFLPRSNDTPKKVVAAPTKVLIENFNDEVENKSTKSVDDIMDELFNNMMEYLEGKILKYFQIMTEIQKEVYKEYTADENFKFYIFINMNVHVKVCNLLATKWARRDIKELYQKAVEYYLHKIIPASSTFSQKCKTKVAEYGRILTGIAFINGDYYLGLTCAVTVLELLPLDSYMFVLVAKWSCQLREFDIFEKYNNLPIKHTQEVAIFQSVCKLYAQFFKIIDTEKQLEIVDQINTIKNEISSKKERTYFCCFALNLINNLLGHAAKLPMYNVEKYGDMVQHFGNEHISTLSIAAARFTEFRDLFGKPPFIYDFEKMPDSLTFLKNIMAIPDFHDAQLSYAKLLLQNGCVQECEKYLVSLLYNGTLLAAPFRVLQPLNALYYLKFRTINDKDKIKSLGAMIALLLGKISDIKNAVEPYSRFRTDLLSDTYTFQAKNVTESVLNKTLVTHVAAIPEHPPSCECFLCYQIITNENFYAERQYSDLLIDGLSIESCNEFYTKIVNCGFPKYKRRKAELHGIVFAKNFQAGVEKQKCAPYFLLTSICEATTHCILANKNIGKVSNDKLCHNIIKCSAYFPLELRYYYLLGRQFKRKIYSLDAYSWINSGANFNIPSSSNNENEMDEMFDNFDAFGIVKKNHGQKRKEPPKSPTREVLANQANVYSNQGKKGVGLSGMSEDERNDFDQARADFKVYQHLFFSEWRRRICHYLGSYLAEEYPWYSAWYFLEARAISLRQNVRLRKSAKFEDLRFKDIVEFKAAVRGLPNDFTLIQLIVDEQNILWLIRCGYDLQPIVLPLTKIRVGKDDISHQMYRILLETDQTVGSNIGKTVMKSQAWSILKEQNAKLELLISDIECEWLNKFRTLLIPFGKIDGAMKANIDAAKNILKNVGFSEERANFLAKLYLHAYPDEYKYLLSIFSFIERETFQNSINSSLQNSIYQKLLQTSPTQLFEKYLKEDRYTVLIVSPELSSYPWESLSIFNSNPFVLRIQSFHFFVRSTKNIQAPLPLKKKSENSYYVLNPGGDLKKAEVRICENINLSKLDGLKCEFPPKEKYLEVLEKNNFYFYIGHGNGSHYVNSASIRQIICKAAVILMGCSSVRIEDEGNGFDGKSAVHDYVIAGAPCTIGCLWKVMSGEIDRFLINFVELCFTEWSSKYFKNGINVIQNIPFRLLIKAMIQARQACEFKTLTGGSVVAYGIPVFNCQSTILSSDDANDSVIILD